MDPFSETSPADSAEPRPLEPARALQRVQISSVAHQCSSSPPRNYLQPRLHLLRDRSSMHMPMGMGRRPCKSDSRGTAKKPREEFCRFKFELEGISEGCSHW